MSPVKSRPAPRRTRDGQRRRTRQAILRAASELLARGASPGISDIAAAADVSRRTVYMHFPTLEHLLADAALEAAREMVEPRFEPDRDPRRRVEAMARAVQRSAVATEAIGRVILRHTIESARPGAPGTPQRGYRRVEWIEMALEPVRAKLSHGRFERLVSALTLVVGWESLIVLRDVRGLSPAEAEEVCVWAADALLGAAMRARNGPAARRPRG